MLRFRNNSYLKNDNASTCSKTQVSFLLLVWLELKQNKELQQL